MMALFCKDVDICSEEECDDSQWNGGPFDDQCLPVSLCGSAHSMEDLF